MLPIVCPLVVQKNGLRIVWTFWISKISHSLKVQSKCKSPRVIQKANAQGWYKRQMPWGKQKNECQKMIQRWIPAGDPKVNTRGQSKSESPAIVSLSRCLKGENIRNLTLAAEAGGPAFISLSRNGKNIRNLTLAGEAGDRAIVSLSRKLVRTKTARTKQLE